MFLTLEKEKWKPLYQTLFNPMEKCNTAKDNSRFPSRIVSTNRKMKKKNNQEEKWKMVVIFKDKKNSPVTLKLGSFFLKIKSVWGNAFEYCGLTPQVR